MVCTSTPTIYFVLAQLWGIPGLECKKWFDHGPRASMFTGVFRCGVMESEEARKRREKENKTLFIRDTENR